MNKNIFEEIKTRLETELNGSMKHFGLWNNQINNESQETPFKFPAVFVEFSSIAFRSETIGVQKSDLEITIHCCFSQLVEDLTLLDFVQSVALALHNWSGTNFSDLTRIQEIQDVDHDRVLDWQIVFTTTMSDCSTHKMLKQTKINDPATVTLEITRSLDIDNQVIRSGDGQ